MKLVIGVPEEVYKAEQELYIEDTMQVPLDVTVNGTSLPKGHGRLIAELEGKSAEEIYEFLNWLLHDYGMRFTDTRLAVIAWLKGE